MTVKQLKEKLNEYPDNMDVFISDLTSGFAFGLVNSVDAVSMDFSESPGGKSMAIETVVVLTEA